MSENGLQGTLLSTMTFPEMTDLVMRTFVQRQQMVDRKALELFIKEPVAKGQGNTKKFTEVDTSTYARRKDEGGAAKKASFGVGYSKLMTKKRVAFEIDITQEMRDENRYTQVGTLMANLGDFAPNRIDLDATHRFTFANATSMTDMDGETVDLTGGDGYAMLSTVHPLAFSSTTWSNRISADPVFSKAALIAGEKLFTTNIFSNFGEKRTMKPNTIITGDDPETVDAVRQFLNSTSDNTQNNSGVVNTYKAAYRHVVLPNLATTAMGAPDSTKRRIWFLANVGVGYNGAQLIYGEWEAAHSKPVDEDGHKDVWSYGTRAGYGFALVSAKGVVGSFVSN
jgi:hypothetical protein